MPTACFYNSYWYFEPGVSLSGAAGYAFDGVRVEGEFSYTVNSIGHWAWESRDANGNVMNRTFIERRLDSIGMMANGWYDLNIGTLVSPYFGGEVAGRPRLWDGHLSANALCPNLTGAPYRAPPELPILAHL